MTIQQTYFFAFRRDFWENQSRRTILNTRRIIFGSCCFKCIEVRWKCEGNLGENSACIPWMKPFRQFHRRIRFLVYNFSQQCRKVTKAAGIFIFLRAMRSCCVNCKVQNVRWSHNTLLFLLTKLFAPFYTCSHGIVIFLHTSLLRSVTSECESYHEKGTFQFRSVKLLRAKYCYGNIVKSVQLLIKSDGKLLRRLLHEVNVEKVDIFWQIFTLLYL